MKLFIIALLLIQNCTSNHQKSTNQHYGEDYSDLPFYNLILQELDNNISNRYSIVIELDKNFHTSEKINQAILTVKALSESEKKQLIDQKGKTGKLDSLPINSKLSRLIKDSKENPTEKLKLKYEFSPPFYFGNKVAILHSKYFLTPSGSVVKGGAERLILFEKAADSWAISQKINLIEY